MAAPTLDQALRDRHMGAALAAAARFASLRPVAYLWDDFPEDHGDNMKPVGCVMAPFVYGAVLMACGRPLRPVFLVSGVLRTKVAGISRNLNPKERRAFNAARRSLA